MYKRSCSTSGYSKQYCRDKLREIAMSEMEYAEKDAAENPLLQSRQEPHQNAFQLALRSNCKRQIKSKPVVRRKQRSQPIFHVRTTIDHIGVAKKAVARFDEYGRQLKPTLDVVYQIRDGRTQGHLASPVDIPMLDTLNPHAPPQDAPNVHYDASRDPRLRGLNH